MNSNAEFRFRNRLGDRSNSASARGVRFGFLRVVLGSAIALSGCGLGQGAGEEKETSASAQARHSEVGKASWYGPGFQGNETANGETFDQDKMTAAHPTLPMGTKAEVTNLENGRTVEVRINDRGPYVGDRSIDLSRAAAKTLDMEDDGTAEVRIVVPPAPSPDGGK
jgi:rare lipoprotein A (peptidoglycan hydrolase)